MELDTNPSTYSSVLKLQPTCLSAKYKQMQCEQTCYCDDKLNNLLILWI